MIAVTETLPIKIMDFASQLPYIGSDDLKNKAKLASKISGKMKDLQDLFHHFINNSWTFETQ